MISFPCVAAIRLVVQVVVVVVSVAMTILWAYRKWSSRRMSCTISSERRDCREVVVPHCFLFLRVFSIYFLLFNAIVRNLRRILVFRECFRTRRPIDRPDARFFLFLCMHRGIQRMFLSTPAKSSTLSKLRGSALTCLRQFCALVTITSAFALSFAVPPLRTDHTTCHLPFCFSVCFARGAFLSPFLPPASKQVSPGSGGCGGGNPAEMPRRPRLIRVDGKQDATVVSVARFTHLASFSGRK